MERAWTPLSVRLHPSTDPDLRFPQILARLIAPRPEQSGQRHPAAFAARGAVCAVLTKRVKPRVISVSDPSADSPLGRLSHPP
jgi:hypothetical protein